MEGISFSLELVGHTIAWRRESRGGRIFLVFPMIPWNGFQILVLDLLSVDGSHNTIYTTSHGSHQVSPLLGRSELAGKWYSEWNGEKKFWYCKDDFGMEYTSFGSYYV